MMLKHLKQYHKQPHEVAALDLLADPSHYTSLPELDNRQIEYQLFLFPSFEPYQTWTVYKSDAGERTVRRIAWHLNEDKQVVLSGPTTYGADGHLSKKDGDNLSDNLSSIMVPAFRFPSSIGLDGTTFGIRKFSFFCRAELSWWCHPPEGWEELAVWYGKAVETFDAILPNRTANL